MPLEVGPAFLAGVALIAFGATVSLAVLWRAGVLGAGARWIHRLEQFSRQPERGRQRAFLGVGLFAAALGGFVSCTSVFMDDEAKDITCQRACQDNGFEGGRFRGNPHMNRPHAEASYGCWCQTEDGWSRHPQTDPHLAPGPKRPP